MFNVTSAWKSAFPGAHVGVLVMRNASSHANHIELEKQKRNWKNASASNLPGRIVPPLRVILFLQIYSEYYKRFKKTYHVQPQLEAIVLKGNSIPTVAALVE